MLRVNRQQAGEPHAAVPLPDPQKLIAGQSPARAIVAGVTATILLCAAWTALTLSTGRIFPWFTMLQGAVIGLLVRRYGRGFDYRFPLIAACLACAGALLGNLVIAVPETAEQLEVSAFRVIRGLTWWSFETFFAEVITPVDYIYAGFGAALAAFYARRRLDRHEEFVLRTIKKSGQE